MFYFLSLAAGLFAIGLFGFLSRRTVIGKLVALFVMLNAVILLFATFNRFVQSDGSTGAVFIAFILLTLFAAFLLGAFLIYQYHSKTKHADENGISLF